MKKQKNKDFSSPKTLTSELKERQSVRASFRLTEGCIDAISIVATQMGIKQKSLFDHLSEDIESLKSIACELKYPKLKTQRRVQKTYVISRKSLASFDEIAMIFNTPRDVLIENSIQRLLPIIIKEREKHEKRKAFLLRIRKHFEEGEKILDDIRKQLGAEPNSLTLMKSIGNFYQVIQSITYNIGSHYIHPFYPKKFESSPYRGGVHEKQRLFYRFKGVGKGESGK